ncbi:hypothetical protein A3Q56_04973 [Intoshia linei]|uniref:Uncharacterized protein n=1 Tax=Intoshia linei TaxID=1819745 RepID=A0A177AZ53_9BILA|nr:hypothetical protein A3Q56_04973 [Intoshia linei]
MQTCIKYLTKNSVDDALINHLFTILNAFTTTSNETDRNINQLCMLTSSNINNANFDIFYHIIRNACESDFQIYMLYTNISHYEILKCHSRTKTDNNLIDNVIESLHYFGFNDGNVRNILHCLSTILNMTNLNNKDAVEIQDYVINNASMHLGLSEENILKIIKLMDDIETHKKKKYNYNKETSTCLSICNSPGFMNRADSKNGFMEYIMNYQFEKLVQNYYKSKEDKINIDELINIYEGENGMFQIIENNQINQNSAESIFKDFYEIKSSKLNINKLDMFVQHFKITIVHNISKVDYKLDHFCDSNYRLNLEELIKILKSSKNDHISQLVSQRNPKYSSCFHLKDYKESIVPIKKISTRKFSKSQKINSPTGLRNVNVNVRKSIAVKNDEIIKNETPHRHSKRYNTNIMNDESESLLIFSSDNFFKKENTSTKLPIIVHNKELKVQSELNDKKAKKYKNDDTSSSSSSSSNKNKIDDKDTNDQVEDEKQRSEEEENEKLKKNANYIKNSITEMEETIEIIERFSNELADKEQNNAILTSATCRDNIEIIKQNKNENNVDKTILKQVEIIQETETLVVKKSLDESESEKNRQQKRMEQLEIMLSRTTSSSADTSTNDTAKGSLERANGNVTGKDTEIATKKLNPTILVNYDDTEKTTNTSSELEKIEIISSESFELIGFNEDKRYSKISKSENGSQETNEKNFEMISEISTTQDEIKQVEINEEASAEVRKFLKKFREATKSEEIDKNILKSKLFTEARTTLYRIYRRNKILSQLHFLKLKGIQDNNSNIGLMRCECIAIDYLKGRKEAYEKWNHKVDDSPLIWFDVNKEMHSILQDNSIETLKQIHETHLKKEHIIFSADLLVHKIVENCIRHTEKLLFLGETLLCIIYPNKSLKISRQYSLKDVRIITISPYADGFIIFNFDAVIYY